MEVLQVDMHLCKIAHYGDIFRSFYQAFLVQLLSSCVVPCPDTHVILVQPGLRAKVARCVTSLETTQTECLVCPEFDVFKSRHDTTTEVLLKLREAFKLLTAGLIVIDLFLILTWSCR